LFYGVCYFEIIGAKVLKNMLLNKGAAVGAIFHCLYALGVVIFSDGRGSKSVKSCFVCIYFPFFAKIFLG